MEKYCKNIYKTAREFAGLTQEEAAYLIPCSVSSLSGYENVGNVPDAIVKRMAIIYKCPMLALLHLKRSDNPLAEFIPDIVPPQTFGDVGMQAVVAHSDIDDAVRIITQLLKDGKITPDEHQDLSQFARIMRIISGRTLSAAVYAETEMIQNGSASSAA